MSFINVPILSTWNGAGVKAAETALGGLGRAVGSLGKTIKGTIVSMIAFNAVQATMSFVSGTVTQARDLERNVKALGYIFQSVTPEMEAFVKTANSMGMSQSQAAQASTFLGSVLSAAGFDLKTTATETQKLTALAADLATVYGYDVSEALSGMTALFRGEYDPIEKFGVAMKQAQVNAILHARGLGNLTGAELLHAQQQIRLEMLYRATTRSQGAFARQSGTLFVEQKKLEAAFTDFQAVLGKTLTPVVTRYITALHDGLASAQPGMVKFFEILKTLGNALMPIFKPIGAIFNSLMGLFNAILAPITNIVESLIGALSPALNIVGGLITGIIDGFTWLTNLIGSILQPVIDVLSVAVFLLARGMELLFGWITSLLKPVGDFFGMVGTGASDAASSIHKFATELMAAQSTVTSFNSGVDTTSIAGILMASTALPKQPDPNKDKLKNYVKDFYDGLAEEVRKQAAQVKLAGMGVSEGLISKILGSDGWETVYKKIVAGGASAVASLQKTFNKTKDGLAELKAAADEAQKALDDYNAKVDEIAGNIADFVKSMGDLLRAVSPMPTVTRQLGEFEQAVADSFQAIYDSLKSAVDNKLLYQSSADDLAAYAKNTQTTLQGIARERDAIAQKIQDANALIDSTKSAVMGFVNLNDLLQTTSQTVTEQTVSMIDGIRLTLTRTFDIETVTNNLTDGFRKILDKTKKFAADLKSLKAMGLSKGLFQQIVSAGLDAGGATAQAILEGGQGTVDELNSLFDDLASVGADVAETTARVMYGAGVDVTNGLIEGLLSQSDQLAQAAQILADSFANSFNARMDAAINADAYLLSGVTPGMPPMGGDVAGLGATPFRAARVPTSNTYEIHVNSGIITDPAATGEAVVNAIVRYERTNGAVWVRSA